MKEKILYILDRSGWLIFCLFVFLTPVLAPSPLIRFGRKLWRLQYGQVYLAVLLIIFLIALLKIFFDFNFKKIFSDRRLFPLSLLAIFIGINLVSLARFFPTLTGASELKNLFNIQTDSGYSAVKFIFLTAGLVTALVAAVFLNSGRRAQTAGKIYILMASLASFYGLALMVKYVLKIGLDPVQKYVARSWVFPRLIGTALEPQTFANFLLSVIFLTLAFYFFEKRRWLKNLFLAGLCLQTLALLATFSLGGIGALAAGLICFWLLAVASPGRQWSREIFIFFLVILFFISLLAVAFPPVRSAVTALWSKSGSPQEYLNWKVWAVRRNPAAYSLIDRQLSRDAALAMFQARPILGWGPGSFGYRYQEFKKSDRFIKEYNRPRAHNQYLEIMAESGVLGLTVFLAWLASLGFFLYKKIRSAPDQRRIFPLAQAATLAAFLAHGTSFGFFPHLYFWLVVGFILGAE